MPQILWTKYNEIPMATLQMIYFITLYKGNEAGAACILYILVMQINEKNNNKHFQSNRFIC